MAGDPNQPAFGRVWASTGAPNPYARGPGGANTGRHANAHRHPPANGHAGASNTVRHTNAYAHANAEGYSDAICYTITGAGSWREFPAAHSRGRLSAPQWLLGIGEGDKVSPASLSSESAQWLVERFEKIFLGYFRGCSNWCVGDRLVTR